MMPFETDKKYSGNPYFELFRNHKNNHHEVAMRSGKKRIAVLTTLSKALFRHRQEFRDALYKDFRKPATETDLTEIYPVLSEIRLVKASLRTWMRPQHAANGLAFIGTRNKIIYTPKGVCLVISPWNYPVLLTLLPLVSAIAAGNNVIIKPSELTSSTSSLLKKFISEIFPENEVALVEGDSNTAIDLLKLPFDHIFFTGSPETGKKVMKAASENLSPVTLELGGKSPAYIHHDSNLKDAAAKITAAKLVNCGQTCVAPDYIIAHHDIKHELITELEKAFKMFYDPAHPDKRNNYASVINEHHYQRLSKFSEMTSNPVPGDKLFLKPVIVSEATMQDAVMQEEIFGPILPVIGVINEEEAVKHIHSLPEPLGIYVFTGDSKVKKLFTNLTRSGSLLFNECAINYLHPGLPFGGVGQSGMGRSRGKAGFITFSNEKVIFTQRTGFTLAKILYPPYGKIKLKLIDWLVKYF